MRLLVAPLPLQRVAVQEVGLGAGAEGEEGVVGGVNVGGEGGGCGEVRGGGGRGLGRGGWRRGRRGEGG